MQGRHSEWRLMVYTIVKALWAITSEGYGQKRVHQKPLLQRPENWRLSIIKWLTNKEAFNPKALKNIDKKYKERKSIKLKEENSPSRSSLKKEVT